MNLYELAKLADRDARRDLKEYRKRLNRETLDLDLCEYARRGRATPDMETCYCILDTALLVVHSSDKWPVEAVCRAWMTALAAAVVFNVKMHRLNDYFSELDIEMKQSVYGNAMIVEHALHKGRDIAVDPGAHAALDFLATTFRLKLQSPWEWEGLRERAPGRQVASHSAKGALRRGIDRDVSQER